MTNKENIERLELVIKALANERPQTISCFNCKHDYKIATDEPCKYCTDKFSEWEAKGDNTMIRRRKTMNEMITIILNDFAEWIKTQPVYIGGEAGEKEVLILRDGEMQSAVEIYLKDNEPTIISEVVEE